MKTLMKGMMARTNGLMNKPLDRTEKMSPASMRGTSMNFVGSHVGTIKKVGAQSGAPADAFTPSAGKLYGRMMQSVKPSGK